MTSLYFFLFFFISVPQPVLHPLLLCPNCAFLHHGSHPMCPLLMASVVIEFDAAHLQPNKRAVCKNPNSPIQRYWYFTGCIIKLNNPLWLEAKWWNSFQWPQLNHKQKAFWCLCIFKASPDCQNAIITAEHEIWAQTDGTLWVPRKCMKCIHAPVICALITMAVYCRGSTVL